MIIETEQLQLRPIKLSDATDLQRLAGDRDVASTTLSIDHPYTEGMAEKWIRSSQRKIAAGTLVTFAITLLADGSFVGAIILHPDDGGKQGELSYWIGKPYWNQGYATEAVEGMLDHAFRTLQFERIYAAHFTRNPSSGRVMQKAGMHYEGSQLGPTVKWGVVENLELYGVTRKQFQIHGSVSPPQTEGRFGS
ncbi:MAG: GNAT family N-acetyltransferase [Dehalococcoidia bacterium]|nr:GNAT family N-acetyltransferase [Dehalococcoidia bacterium]MEE3246310.1 GNAT family N-acetyltransferase [Chloroflexota bacterium]